MKPEIEIDHLTGNHVPYTIREFEVCGFFNVPCYNHVTLKMLNMQEMVYSPYPRLEDSNV